MQASEIVQGELIWWKPKPDERVLCRVVVVGKQYTSIRVVAGDAAQVIRTGWGVGEILHLGTSGDVFEKVSH